MLKKVLLALMLAALILPASAQDLERIKADSARYLWAEGFGKNIDEADADALSSLIKRISVNVKDSFEQQERQSIVNGSITSDSKIESKVQTFAGASLNNCSRLIVKNEFENCIVLRYIERKEINNIFDARKKKIREFLDIAMRAEKELKIDDALKYMYWSQLLLNSLPSGNTVFYGEGDEAKECDVWIPKMISAILDKLEFKFNGYVSEDRTLGLLGITYGGRAVSSVDFTCFDGVAFSDVIQAKNGKGPVELRKNVAVKSINVTVEYAYAREAKLDKDLKWLIDNVNMPSFKEAYKYNIDLTASTAGSITASPGGVTMPLSGQIPQLETPQMPVTADMSRLESVNSESMSATVMSVLSLLKPGNTQNGARYFTAEGLSIFNSLLKYGKAKVLEIPQFKYYTLHDHTFCRSVPMMFSFPGYSAKFVENVVFEFDRSGKICNINFALEDISIKEISGKTQWTAEAKMVLMNFLENYKTAFALGRLDYIKSIFSEDALIITGRVLKRTYLENQIRGTDQIVIYNRQTKSQYIEHLSRCFQSKDYINLKFTNVRLLRMNRGTNPNVFSIQLRQDYCSSNYSDSGYLFLLVDMDNYEKPVIHVRTWQPKPDERFGVFGPEDDIYS